MSEPTVEVKALANFLTPFAQGIRMSGDKELAQKLERVAFWLGKLSYTDICGDGYIGCQGGSNCQSDHK